MEGVQSEYHSFPPSHEKTVQLITVSSQWFIQLSLVIFMYQSKTDRAAVMRTVIMGGVITALLIGVAASTLYTNSYTLIYAGYTISQALMALFFLGVLCTSCKASIKPRPAAIMWSVFQLVTHFAYVVPQALLWDGKYPIPANCLLGKFLILLKANVSHCGVGIQYQLCPHVGIYHVDGQSQLETQRFAVEECGKL